MGDFQIVLTMLFLAVLIFFVILTICRFIGLWTWTATWVFSSKEEKLNLTKSKGHYNANGYFVPSDSMGDINLCYSGSFKRFDPVDHDYKIAMTTFSPPPSSEQVLSYPQEISLPYATVQSNDLSEFTKPSCYGSNTGNQTLYRTGNTPGFSSSQPALMSPPTSYMSSSVSFGREPISENIPPQPLRLAPAPPPSFTGTETMAKTDAKKPEPSSIRVPITPPPIPPRSKVPRQESPPVKLRSQASLEREEALTQVQGLQRAISCESVSSDTSIALADLEEPHVTGYLCIGLDYDSECADLSVSVLEAKDLVGPDPENQTLMDTYVRVNLLPDKTTNIQTRVYKKSNSPSYKEKFLFALEPNEFSIRSLSFNVYCSDKNSNTLIGEGDLRLCDVSSRQGVTTWITLTDTGQTRTEWGELMLSLSYLPTAERLTVVVVKARNLVFPQQRDSGDPFVKVYLLKQGKKIYKKKTSVKKRERSPIFNEAMIFNVPAASLQNLQLRLTVAENIGEPKACSLGHVILGSEASGKALSHWIQMLSTLRKPISMWHSLRK
ncbi:hypothetical protein RUM44_002388 [Polyplax serrata]|uniref:C2 domain-containing protein n=1 Tax=Polyplax serrata TaxID=468196 RepID=A0ABR1AEN1_POLSC